MIEISKKLTKISFNSDIKIFNDYLKFCVNLKHGNDLIDQEFDVFNSARSKIQKNDSDKFDAFAEKNNINLHNSFLIADTKQNTHQNNLNTSKKKIILDMSSFIGKDDNFIKEMITNKDKDEENLYFHNLDSSFNNLENEIENLIEKYNVNQRKHTQIKNDSSGDESDANIIFSKLLEKKDFNVFNFSEMNNIIIKENHFNFDDKSIMKKDFPAYHSFTKIHFENKFKINKKINKKEFTNKDSIMFNNKDVRMTNSVLFYFNHFYKKYEFFKFNTKLINIKTKYRFYINLENNLYL